MFSLIYWFKNINSFLCDNRCPTLDVKLKETWGELRFCIQSVNQNIIAMKDSTRIDEYYAFWIYVKSWQNLLVLEIGWENLLWYYLGHACPLHFCWYMNALEGLLTDISDNLAITLVTHDDKLDNTHTQDNDLTDNMTTHDDLTITQ